MVNKTLTTVLLCLAALWIACGTLLAANPDDRIPQMASWVASPLIHPGNTKSPHLVTIYSNLGSSTDAYTDNAGWNVAGPNSILGESQWIAMPFTPAANSTVTQIKIAVEYGNSGTNGFTLSLNCPITVPLKTWEVKNLPTFGTCCTLDVAKGKIKVKKGKQCWVVAQTDSTNGDAFDFWDYTWNDSTGPYAYNINNGGWTPTNGPLSAFGVFGTRP